MMHSDKTMNLIMNSALDAIICMDQKGTIILWTKQAEKIFGWSESEVTGKPLSETIIPHRYRERHVSGLKRYLEGGGNKVLNRVVEIEGLNREGKEFPIELTIVPVKEGGSEFFCAFLRDISERKAVEEKLNQNRIFIESLISASPDIIYIYDIEEGKNIFVNDGIQKNLGYTDVEIKQMGDQVLPILMHPDDFNIYWEKTYPRYADTKDKEIIQHEFRMRDKEGVWHWLLCKESIFNRNPDGTPKQIFGMTVDITDRKKAEDKLRQSEQRYHSLIDQASDAILVADFEGHFFHVNQSLCNISGYSREELMMMNVAELVEPENLKSTPIPFDRFKAGEHLFTDRRVLLKNGTILDMEVNAKKIGDDMILAIARDVTERKKVLMELAESHHQLRMLSSHLETIREEERTHIAREIHDELGQQLTGLKMDLSSLDKKILPDNKAAHKKIKSMMSLLNETMQTVRQISSSLRPGILDDLGLIDALQWQSNEFEKRTGIPCQFKARLNSRSIEKNHSTGIFRIYQETLTNVARHAKATKVTAKLEVNKDNIILKVQDNGKGFDQAAIKNKNTLGLIGMKERAAMFDGKIDLQSEKGKGTLVTLFVPLNKAKK